MFTNPIFSAFFRKGQVIETFRGKGIYQPAVDLAIEKLRAGAWIHLFGEGKVCQSDMYKADPHTGIARLQRFRWGIGRILMETHRLPTIIPMWITGFDKLMPEGRRAPWKFLPRQGARLSVTFGTPLSPAVVRATMASASASASGTAPAPWCDDGEGSEQSTGMPVKMDAEAEVKVRIALTELMQHAVEALGRQESGDSLTGLPHHHHDHHRT